MRKFYVEFAGNKIFTALVRFTFRFWRRGLAVLFLLCCIIQYSNSQIVTEGPAIKANFGIDADIYANYLLDPALAGETAAGTDDWFMNDSIYQGSGMSVFDPSQTFIDDIIAALAIDENKSFTIRMGVARNSEIEIPSSPGDIIVWIDGVYARDNNTAGNGKDSSAFAGTSDKNFQDPSTWNTGIKDPYQKGDLIDVFGHMREDPNGDVWGIGAFSTRSSSGSVHADFEFFANQLGYEGAGFTNTGPDHGHSSWTFDPDGVVLTAGDLITSIDYEQGGEDPVASIRVWVSEADYNYGLANWGAAASFNFTGAFTTESGAGFGYAEIQPAVGGVDPAAWAVVNVDSISPAPPWGTLEGPQADINDGYLPLQFAEFAINMSFLGLDAFGGDACNKTLGSLLVKTRSSPSFESEMHDFVGPLLFGYDLETKIVAMDLDSCDDGVNQFDLMTAVDSFGDGIVTFYATSDDAFADPPVNAISSSQTLPVGDTMFWARSSNPDDEGCFAVDSFMVTVHDNPVCNVTTTDETYFNAGNGTAKVTVTGGEGPFTYLWVPSNGGTIGGGQGTDSIYDLTDGRYDVYITDANGCETSCYDSLSWAPTAPTCAVFAIDVECFGAETGTVWAEVTPSDTIGYPPYTYYWFKDGTPFDTVISNETTDTMFNMGAGIYDVEVLNAVDPNSTLCYDTIFQPDPNPVSVECAGVTIDGCQGQSSVDLDFGNWLDTAFVVTGGTDPLDTVYKVGDVVVDLDTVSAPYYCGGDVNVRMIVSDYCGLVDSCDATFSVTPDVTPPVITGVEADTTIECPDVPSWSVPSANDACFGPVQLTMEDDTSSFACPLVITRTWKAEDDCGNTSMASQTITVIDTTPPMITGVGADTTIECPNDPVFSTPQASDGCDDNVTLTSSMDTSSYACPLVITKTWKAEDDCGNTTMASQTITVIDTTPPMITGVAADTTIECPNDPVFSTPQASDGCDDNVTLTSSMDTSSYACPLVITKTWKAEDDCGNTSMVSQTITVIDTTPPVITGVGDDMEIECPNDPVFSTPQASDGCDDNVTLTSSMDTSSYACPLVITKTWKAEDDCGNTSMASQTITVIDTTPPVITGVGDDMEIECPNDPVFSTPQASDGCDDNVTLTSSMDTSSYACPLVITKTWKAEDDCGNTSMASQTITVIDTTPPILILPVDYEDYLCNDYPGDLTATFTDECSDNGSITVSPVMSGSTLCEEIYTYTFSARDDCGNTTTDSITVVREWESLEDCETAFARLPEDLPAPSRPYDSKTNPDPYAGTDAIGARCFIDDVFERWGWVNRVKKDSTYYLPVYAGAGQCDVTKGDSVGTVTLAFYGDTVTVMFDLIAPWVMTEAHIYVGEDMYPTFKNGKHKDEATVAPGQYNLVYENGDPITDLKVGYYNAPEYVYVIVHAVTCRPLCYCDETIYQGFDAGLYSLVQTRGNKNKAAVTSDVTDFVSGELKVFPNPFTEKVTFEFVSATDSYGTLDIYSVTGQHVARILDRPVLSGELNSINYEPDHDVSGIYIYRLKLDDNVQVGRIIYKE